jgi:MoaA/NifB/PqqE/SkfB family radical SAM enzyme
MRRPPLEFLLRYGYNALRIRLPGGRNKIRIKPLMASLYLTTKCNFRCTYCDDGSGTLYPHLPEPGRLDTPDVFRALDIMRRASPGIAITGGEPPLHPGLTAIMAHIARLGFAPVALNTNGYLLDRHLDLLAHLDYLVVSLDATDEGRSDALINAGPGRPHTCQAESGSGR